MLNREIAFRPRLEGDFRIRFYNAVSCINEATAPRDIERLADTEIRWVTNDCTYNLDQRKKYRAVWFLFRDLIHANWKACYRDGVLYMSLPSLNGVSVYDSSAPEVKEMLRGWMSESRRERLITFADFIKHMESMNSRGLERVHLVTRLDKAILDAAKSGKDIVLTGNPGDGKTHIIRLIKKELDKLKKPMEIVLDASTLSNEEIYEKWVAAHKDGNAYVIAINAAVLYSVYKEHRDFAPIVEAYNTMASAVVFHNEDAETENVVVFDLSKREVLTPEILAQAIKKLTAQEHYSECKSCPLCVDCVVTKNRKLLNDELFQKRLAIVLDRVVLQGYHATLREMQSLIAFLLFGDRSCTQLNQTAGNDKYDIANLIYTGKGGLFDAIRRSIDPVKISHPKWDEKILLNDLEPDSWVKGYEVPAEAIAFDNEELFKLRKRQFYYFNTHGEELLRILDDDLYSGNIISDAEEATRVIKEVIFEESEKRGRLLAEARVPNIIEYNKRAEHKLAPIVVVIDEFADLSDQLETKREKDAFYKPVQRIAQAGRSRGIHLVICTQRPEAKLVPPTTKAQLNGRVALRVNDGTSSRMIIEQSDAQYLQKHGDMIYRNGDTFERAQGYLIEISELESIIDKVVLLNGK